MSNQIDIMYKQLIKISGTDGLINNNSYRFLITEVNDNNENNYDLKYIITEQEIKQGDYVTFNNILYMILDVEKPINSIYTKGTFREVLKITLESNLKDIYAVVDKKSNVFEQGSEIAEVHDEYTFIIPEDSCNLTSATPVDNAIIYVGGSYDAISIDDSKEGILIITGRFNSIYNPHTYVISLSSNSETLEETGTYTIVATCTDNSKAVDNPTIEYTSSDETIATVSSSGVVLGIKEGSCNINCTYNGVSAILSLTVIAKASNPVISYTTSWSQSITALKQYMTTTLSVVKTIEGVVDSTLYIGYSFDTNVQSLISAGKIVVTRKSDSSISIKNSSVTSSTSIYLTVIDKATGTIILDNQPITLTGM